MSKQVTCTTKRGSLFDPHERISAIGGKNWDGTFWKTTEEQAIQAIESERETFYVSVNYQNVDIVVETHLGRKYLKTKPDGYSPNNLLSLPDCP